MEKSFGKQLGITISPKRIMYVGELTQGGTCRQRMEALIKLGHDITPVEVKANAMKLELLASRIGFKLFRLGVPFLSPFDHAGANREIQRQILGKEYDILWVDKALMISPQAITAFKGTFPKATVIAYSPDDMCGRHNQSYRFLKTLPLIDLYVTTKSYNVSELKDLGCKRVYLIDKSFDPDTHFPVEISSSERSQIGGAVGFIGGFERERANSINYLARNGVPVTVYSNSWPKSEPEIPELKVNHFAMEGDEYRKAINAFDIGLCFLRKLNRDRQTARSIEIPACGVFMLAERTDEHLRLFEEGKEAEYFSTDEELLKKARFYCDHPELRKQIAKRGYERCYQDGYSHLHRLDQILQQVYN